VEGSQVFQTSTSKGFKVKDYTSRDTLSTEIDTEILIPLPKLPALPPSLGFKYKLKKQIPALKPRVAILNFTVREPTQTEVS